MELAYAVRSTLADAATALPGPARSLAGQPPRLPPRTPGYGFGLLWAASEWTRAAPFRWKRWRRSCAAGVLSSSACSKARASEGPAGRMGIIPLWRQTQAIGAAASAMLTLEPGHQHRCHGVRTCWAPGSPDILLLKHQPDWRWMKAGPTLPGIPVCDFSANRHRETGQRVDEVVSALEQWH